MTENNLILVSNWDKVEEDDFYLSDDWAKNEGVESIAEARKMQKEGHLYEAYIVDAKHYALYRQMDSDKVFIDAEANVILHCESAVINDDHDYRIEYEY